MNGGVALGKAGGKGAPLHGGGAAPPDSDSMRGLLRPEATCNEGLPSMAMHYVVAFRRRGSRQRWNTAGDYVNVADAKKLADEISKDHKDWEVEVWAVHPVYLK